MSHDANSHRTQCDQCFTHTKVAAALIGKRIKCRSCGHVFIVDPPPPELKKFKDSPIVPQPKPLPTPANDGTAPQQTTAASVPDLRITHRPGQYTPERRKKLPNYALAENITRHIATGASVALFFSIGSSFALLQDDKGTRRNNFVFCISLRSSLLCGAMTAILHRRGAKSAEVVGAKTRTHLSSSPKYVRSYRDENGRRVKVYEADGKPNATFGDAILGALGLGACGFLLGCLFGGSKSSRR